MTQPLSDENDADPAASAATLLRLTGDLARELHPRGLPPGAASLDSALDRDLGFDSLGRVELVARIEAAFDVTLPDQVLASAETPRDLLRAVLGAAGRRQSITTADVGATALGEAEAAPHGARTLVEVLEWHVLAHADRPHIRLYADQGEGDVITYGDLWRGAEAVAGGLRRQDVHPGDRVVIMLPTGREYFFSFFGTLLAGAVPVPVYPPARPAQIEEHLRRHIAIIANCQAPVLVTVPEGKRLGGLLRAHVDGLRAVVTVDDLTGAGTTPARPRLDPGDTAFLQYTSGSTGAPKGVVLSHANLLANIRAVGEAVNATPEDVFVSWLPLYHDMGLIGAWLGSLHFAVPLVLMPPLAFLGRPQRWLWAIHRYGGTISAAPNFAYEQCLGRIRDADIEGLDLSSWRLALNGAEAVSAQTIRRFGERFGAYGFGEKTMYPVYGLAESSVGLTLPPLGRGPLIDRVERAIFQRTGNAVPAPEEDGQALEFVRCGHPLPGHQVRIVDEAGRELPERHAGRLQFQGPSATSGYFRDARATADLFDGDWLESGDLAYVTGGDVCITGRIKDMIVRAGRNIYPVELEDAVGAIDGIRKGNVAVFGSADGRTGTERLVILAETTKRDAAARQTLHARINGVITDLLEIPPDDIVLAPPNTVLRTSSGKIRRAATKALYEAGLVGKPRRAVWWQMTRRSLTSWGRRGRRAGRGAAAVLYAAYAWILVGLAAPVLWTTVALLPGRTWRWRSVRRMLRLLFPALGMPITVRGLDNLPPPDRSWMIVSNHASYLDSPLLMAALPADLAFVVKGELEGNFLARLFLERLGALFVERLDVRKSIADTRRIAAAVGPGRPLVFFPEGTLTRMPGLLPFHMGAFLVAGEAAIPVVPVVVRGSRAVLRDGSWFPRPGAITVTIGEPIVGQAGAAGWAAAVTLRDAVRRHILDHCGEPDLSHERPRFEAPE